MANWLSTKCGWAVALLTVLNLAVIGFSLFRPPHRPPPRDLTPLWQRELGLSPEQTSQLVQLEREHRKKGETLSGQMNQLKREMVELAVLHPLDSMALDSVFRASNQVHAALNRHKIDYYENVKALCTPAQQEKLRAVFLKVLDRPEPGPARPR